MKTSKVDYSELVDALKEQDKKIIEQQIKELRPRLCTYLRVTMDASLEDAEDAVQEAFTEVYAKLMSGKLKEKKYFFKYLLRACRNEYLMLMRYENRQEGTLDDIPQYLVAPSEQIEKLIDEEHQQLLKKCIESLPQKYRDFALYYCKQHKWNPEAAAQHFDVSNNNIRLIKLRTLSKLSDCVKQKLKDDRFEN